MTWKTFYDAANVKLSASNSISVSPTHRAGIREETSEPALKKRKWSHLHLGNAENHENIAREEEEFARV